MNAAALCFDNMISLLMTLTKSGFHASTARCVLTGRLRFAIGVSDRGAAMDQAAHANVIG